MGSSLVFLSKTEFLAGDRDGFVAKWEVDQHRDSQLEETFVSPVNAISIDSTSPSLTIAAGVTRLEPPPLPFGQLVSMDQHDQSPAGRTPVWCSRLPDMMVSAVGFSADGRLMATGSGTLAGGEGVVSLWEWPGGKLVARAEQKGGIQGLQFSPDGKWLASTGAFEVAMTGETMLFQMTLRNRALLRFESWQTDRW